MKYLVKMTNKETGKVIYSGKGICNYACEIEELKDTAYSTEAQAKRNVQYKTAQKYIDYKHKVEIIAVEA